MRHARTLSGVGKASGSTDGRQATRALMQPVKAGLSPLYPASMEARTRARSVKRPTSSGGSSARDSPDRCIDRVSGLSIMCATSGQEAASPIRARMSWKRSGLSPAHTRTGEQSSRLSHTMGREWMCSVSRASSRRRSSSRVQVHVSCLKAHMAWHSREGGRVSSSVALSVPHIFRLCVYGERGSDSNCRRGRTSSSTYGGRTRLLLARISTATRSSTPQMWLLSSAERSASRSMQPASRGPVQKPA